MRIEPLRCKYMLISLQVDDVDLVLFKAAFPHVWPTLLLNSAWRLFIKALRAHITVTLRVLVLTPERSLLLGSAKAVSPIL